MARLGHCNWHWIKEQGAKSHKVVYFGIKLSHVNCRPAWFRFSQSLEGSYVLYSVYNDQGSCGKVDISQKQI